jgi:GMP synthase (glutamine-hydrolysing)
VERKRWGASGRCGGVVSGALGAKVRPCEAKEIGGYEASLTRAGRDDAVLAGFPQIFPVFQWHGDRFELPEGSQLLVEGRSCRNQMFRLDTVIGVQFHLEVASDQAATWTVEYAAELASEGKTAMQVISDCRKREAIMARLAERLLRNFLQSLAGLQIAV